MNLNDIASLATAAGVAIAAWQIWESRKLASATFEDSFDQQYRALAYSIPMDAFLGLPLKPEKMEQAREAVFNYLDLCNEQIYQRSKGRISGARWDEWAQGIKHNLDRPFFKSVWVEVKDMASDSLSFLERFENENFKSDPAKWR